MTRLDARAFMGSQTLHFPDFRHSGTLKNGEDSPLFPDDIGHHHGKSVLGKPGIVIGGKPWLGEPGEEEHPGQVGQDPEKNAELEGFMQVPDRHDLDHFPVVLGVAPVRVSDQENLSGLFQEDPEILAGYGPASRLDLPWEQFHGIGGQPVGEATERTVPLPQGNGQGVRRYCGNGRGRNKDAAEKRGNLQQVAPGDVPFSCRFVVNLDLAAPGDLGDGVRQFLEPEPVGAPAVIKPDGRIDRQGEGGGVRQGRGGGTGSAPGRGGLEQSPGTNNGRIPRPGGGTRAQGAGKTRPGGPR